MNRDAHKHLNEVARALAAEDHRTRLTDLRQLPQIIASALVSLRTTDAALEAMDVLDRSCQQEYGRLLEVHDGLR